MIIILGPDHSGKSRLADELLRQGKHQLYHFDMHTKYEEYLLPLARLDYMDSVLDRYILCELVYAPLKNRKIQYSPKEFQNILLLTMIQRPVVVLGVAIPPKSEYEKGEYLEWENLRLALNGYVRLLQSYGIPYLEYDYRVMSAPKVASRLLTIEDAYLKMIEWWVPMWKGGYGCVGSPDPKVVIIAERLGPYNYRHVPFEAGPTGLMMTELMEGVPISDYTLTNWIKTGDSRQDAALLREELSNLRPSFVILMGNVAKAAIPLLNEMNIPYRHIPHLGYVNRNRHIWPRYKESFRKLWKEIA